MRRGLAHAKTDFKDRRSLAPECGGPVQRLGLVWGDVGRSQLVHRPLLSRRGTPGAPDERTDSARVRDIIARVGIGGGSVGRLPRGAFGVVARQRLGDGVLGKHGNKKPPGGSPIIASIGCQRRLA
jgi:hypothetical protein